MSLLEHTSGPLPKSDSVQSLVSLIHSPSNPTPAPIVDHSTVQGTDGSSHMHSVAVTAETDYISLSGLGLETVTMNALNSAVAVRVREISLAANALDCLDLSALSSCSALVVLTLNSNRISKLDLQPLAHCTKLERLWLHDNQLEQIDLSPLRACRMLRSLYMEDNSMHSSTLDLSPLTATQNLRSLRLGGNRLGGKIDLTPLFQCPALSVFNIDTAVSLIADGDPTLARVSPALRRIVINIKFTGKPIGELPRPGKGRTTPPVSPKNGCTPGRPRRRVSPPTPPGRRKQEQNGTVRDNKATAPPPEPSPVVKILLVGFRRLARYAAEDVFSRCGKVMIRAFDNSVATSNPSLLLDSHVVLLYTPNEKTLRQVTVVVGRIPTVVTGTGRYRNSADNRMLELLDHFNFYSDPISADDAKAIYDMGRDQAIGVCASSPKVRSGSSASRIESGSSPISDEDGEDGAVGTSRTIRKSHSESELPSAMGAVNIEFEDIDDDHDGKDDESGMPRSRSAEGFQDKANGAAKGPKLPCATWSEVTRKLQERRGRNTGRGWGSYVGGELSVHGRNKLRAEQAAVEAGFSDLGGYATIESCAGLARSVGLPKCAGPSLFRAAFGSTFETESTTPEAGVPNAPMERKSRRISADSFLIYWDARLKAFDGEERLSNILEDSHLSRSRSSDSNQGHSPYGAPRPRKTKSLNGATSLSLQRMGRRRYGEFTRSESMRSDSGLLMRRNTLQANASSDLCCPCDEGVEALITAFMEGRSSRFGSFALVKMSEAIAIGSALVIYGLRGTSKNRVGGRARAVCPKEVREGKLNAALIAAEVGIFEGVAAGLSMDQIRSVKGSFATEASPDAIPRNGGLAVHCTLSVEDVQRFCASRKTLLPGAVKLAMRTHCGNPKHMTLAEFAVLWAVLKNVGSNGAVDYLFTVVDVDHDERWTLPDLRESHMEKERLWLREGMAVSDLVDVWVNLIDMIRPSDAARGISRREFCQLGVKDRKAVLQSLLFIDDDHSLVNIRRTMELNKHSATSVVMM